MISTRSIRMFSSYCVEPGVTPQKKPSISPAGQNAPGPAQHAPTA